MTQGASQPLQVVLCEEESAGRIVVDLEAFVRFGDDLDVSLNRLLQRWIHARPPRFGKRRIKQRPPVEDE